MHYKGADQLLAVKALNEFDPKCAAADANALQEASYRQQGLQHMSRGGWSAVVHALPASYGCYLADSG